MADTCKIISTISFWFGLNSQNSIEYVCLFFYCGCFDKITLKIKKNIYYFDDSFLFVAAAENRRLNIFSDVYVCIFTKSFMNNKIYLSALFAFFAWKIRNEIYIISPPVVCMCWYSYCKMFSWWQQLLQNSWFTEYVEGPFKSRLQKS